MKFSVKVLMAGLSLTLFSLSISYAQVTHITVRAKAKDAKFIGTSIGGAQIIIKNARTGEILAKGLTSGGTGNTEKIMKVPRKRKEAITDDNTAKFTADLNLKEPVFATVEAYAPFIKRQATIWSATQLWLIPGKDIDGEGLILEVPGFVVDILSPQTHESAKTGDSISIKANVVMMCGCPITEGGLWDAAQYEVKALITNGTTGAIQETPLHYSGKPSTFETQVTLEKGAYHLSVYAYDPKTGNTGLDQTSIIIN